MAKSSKDTRSSQNYNSFDGKTLEAEAVNDGASISQSCINLVKNIVGAGALSLATGPGTGTGIMLSLVLLTVLGACSGYMFFLVGKVCAATGERTFKGLGRATAGPRFANIIDIVCVSKTFLTCLAYSIVIADSFPGIMLAIGAPAWACGRTTILLILTVTFIVPLCFLKDLSMLAYTSMLGIGGMGYTALFILWRYLDASYALGGKFYDTAPFKPDFSGGINMWSYNITSMVFLCAVSSAFIAHYNAPKFYDQLQARSIQRFSKVVSVAFSIALLFFIFMMVAAFKTFGKSCQGNVLNNYSNKDPFATMARVGVGFSTVFTYPLALTGLRDGAIALSGLEMTDSVFYGFTVVVLSLITNIALIVTNLGFVNKLGGALTGAVIIYIFPCLLFMFASRKQIIPSSALEMAFAGIVLAFGITLMILGTILAILEEFNPLLLAK